MSAQRAKILHLFDRNANGIIDREEARQPARVLISPAPGVAAIDYGDLSPGPDGVPRLNPIFRLWFLDREGRVVANAIGLNDPRVASFDFSMEVFGWGRGYRTLPGGARVAEGAEAATLRGIFTTAADVHSGLQAYDPTQQNTATKGAKGAVGGRARTSFSGALQYDLGGSTDRGDVLAVNGLSLDDPDGDGSVNELTEGDVDAAEFYMLHTPPPATHASAASRTGRKVLRQIGCFRCHVEDWQLEARRTEAGLTGDRRLFNFTIDAISDGRGSTQLTGVLRPSHTQTAPGRYTSSGDAFRIKGVYSDFKQCDIGPAFHERRFDATLQREHRTAPLWGVGSSQPYGHAGQFLSLDEVVSAHGGEAAREGAAYRALSRVRRSLALKFLESLVLYPTDLIPAVINGDRRISDDFFVAGQHVGYERFDARFLFFVPPRYRFIRSVSDHAGRPVPLSVISRSPDEIRRQWSLIARLLTRTVENSARD